MCDSVRRRSSTRMPCSRSLSVIPAQSFRNSSTIIYTTGAGNMVPPRDPDDDDESEDEEDDDRNEELDPAVIREPDANRSTSRTSFYGCRGSLRPREDIRTVNGWVHSVRGWHRHTRAAAKKPATPWDAPSLGLHPPATRSPMRHQSPFLSTLI